MRALFLLVVLAIPVSAQIPAIAAGTRIKIEAVSTPDVVGTLVSQSVDSLSVAGVNAVRTMIPAATVSRIRASRGRSSEAGRRRGLGIGALIGVGAGAVTGFTVAGGSADNRARGAVFFGGAFGLGSALVGAGVGALIGVERWTTLYTSPSRIGLAQPSVNRGIGVAIAF